MSEYLYSALKYCNSKALIIVSLPAAPCFDTVFLSPLA